MWLIAETPEFVLHTCLRFYTLALIPKDKKCLKPVCKFLFFFNEYKEASFCCNFFCFLEFSDAMFDLNASQGVVETQPAREILLFLPSFATEKLSKA